MTGFADNFYPIVLIMLLFQASINFILQKTSRIFYFLSIYLFKFFSASDSCKRQANQFREKVCACMDKAKEEMKQRMQSADSNPMAALSNLREQAGGWQADLNQCGIDTNAMMNDLRPKLQEYMLKVGVHF